MLDLLRERPRTTGELAEALGESRFLVMQHLGLLREADLVVAEVDGRRRINHLNPVPIQGAPAPDPVRPRGELVFAGPLARNERYRGIFVFNVKTAAEAEALLASDPAVKAGALAGEVYLLYGSAALQEVTAIHRRIEKP